MGGLPAVAEWIFRRPTTIDEVNSHHGKPPRGNGMGWTKKVSSGWGSAL